MRDLTVSNSVNLNGSREFNHVRITNLEDFFNSYENNLEYYKSPFAILADLEEQVKFENKPEQTILCEYKPHGDIIFYFVNMYEQDNLRIVEYEYASSVS
jgi:hypothetical protein